MNVKQIRALLVLIALAFSLLILIVLFNSRQIKIDTSNNPILRISMAPVQSVTPNPSTTDEERWGDASISPIRKKKTVTQCTADVKRCPDGSYVNRVPPQCEFAPCGP